jgi:apolipoprotein N-acyltransferase
VAALDRTLDAGPGARRGLVRAARRRGADAIVTVSNDGWFVGDTGPRLHLIAAAFRSIETRLPQLRATNSGLSALILPTGELRATTGFGVPAALRVAVPRLARGRTLAVAWGDWLGPVGSAGAGLILLALWVYKRRRTT